MITLRIENDRIIKKLMALGFSRIQIDKVRRVYIEVDQELTDEGWTY